MIEDIFNKMIDKENLSFLYLTEGAIFGILGFILYLELSPKLGNIWYRKNYQNIREFQPMFILPYLKKPFQSKILWYPQNWDLNPYVISTLSAIGFYSLRKYIDNLLLTSHKI